MRFSDQSDRSSIQNLAHPTSLTEFKGGPPRYPPFSETPQTTISRARIIHSTGLRSNGYIISERFGTGETSETTFGRVVEPHNQCKNQWNQTSGSILKILGCWWNEQVVQRPWRPITLSNNYLGTLWHQYESFPRNFGILWSQFVSTRPQRRP